MVKQIRKLALAVALTLALSNMAMAVETNESSNDDQSMIWHVLTAPITIPANLLAVPYQGMFMGHQATEKIENETGRVWVRIAMAPLWIPAAILNLPSGLLAPTGLTTGY